MRSLILIFLLFTTYTVSAAPMLAFEFDNAEQEATFQKLSHELRCLVCQNQSISDSNAGLAQDLRNEIYNMLQQGKTEQEIIDFMVQRYGDFVLYNPPVKPMTWVLWFGPLIIFFIALYYTLQTIKSKKVATASVELNADEVERLKNLQAEAGQTSQRQE